MSLYTQLHNKLFQKMNLLLLFSRLHKHGGHGFSYSRICSRQSSVIQRLFTSTSSTTSIHSSFNDFFDDDYPTHEFEDNDQEGNLPMNEETNIDKDNVFESVYFDMGSNIAQSSSQLFEPTPSFSDSNDNDTIQRFQAAQVSSSTMAFLNRSSNGYGSSTTTLEFLEQQLSSVQDEIYELNNGETFNINSPKQVAKVLYGPNEMKESTNKDVLEALAGAGNKIAEKVLLYRKIKSDIKRNKFKQERIEDERRAKEERQQHEEDEKSLHGSGTFRKNKLGVRDPLVLVDASAYIFRAYYSMPPLHRQDGTPVGAVLGVCNMINRLILTRSIRGDRPRFALIFDGVRKRKSFRHELYEEYKSNRPPCPVDLVPQFDLVRDAAIAYGIPCLEANGYEADDVIATLSTMALEDGVDVNIVSSDKDLMQLVTPSNIEPSLQMIDPMKMGRVLDDKEVEKKWGVTPEKLGDVLALAGDSSDNIPGVPGIGPKTAATLINEYGDLEGLLSNLESIKQKGRREKLMLNVDQVRM